MIEILQIDRRRKDRIGVPNYGRTSAASRSRLVQHHILMAADIVKYLSRTNPIIRKVADSPNFPRQSINDTMASWYYK